MDGALPVDLGVYAFVMDGVGVYVGLTTMGLPKRIRLYVRLGPTQTTSIRVKALLLQQLREGRQIQIYTVTPPDMEWNGMPVGGATGLEHGLISAYALAWNIRGASAAWQPSGNHGHHDALRTG